MSCMMIFIMMEQLDWALTIVFVEVVPSMNIEKYNYTFQRAKKKKNGGDYKILFFFLAIIIPFF